MDVNSSRLRPKDQQRTVHDLTGLVKLVGDPRRLFAAGGESNLWLGTMGDDIKVVVKVTRPHTGCEPEVEVMELGQQYQVDIWSALVHPNIAPLLGTCYPQSLGARLHVDHLALVSPYYGKGDILQYIKSRISAGSTQGDVLRFKIELFAAVAEGLAYMHGLGIGHGDMKSRNILVDDGGNPRIIDFGLSRLFTDDEFSLAATHAGGAVGSARWMAPELIAPQSTEHGDSDTSVQAFVPLPTAASDAWALSMVGLEIMTGCRPFHHLCTNAHVIVAIARGARPSFSPCSSCSETAIEIPNEVRALLEQCWALNPSERPAVAEILAALNRLLTGMVQSDPSAQNTTY